MISSFTGRHREEIADLMAEALQNRADESALTRVRDKVRELTGKFPLPS